MRLAALLCIAAALALPASAQISVRDDRGVELRLATPPQRIVSLLPSLTESVCALGACGRLVGTDRYSNFPAEVRALPKLGGLDDAHVEAIVALKPDVVLLAGSARVAGRLEALGVKVLALEPRNLADVQRVLQVLGSLLAASDAQRVWQAIEAGTEAAARSVAPAARGMTVYVEIDSAPYAAGEASFIGQTLARLGLRNIVPASLGPFPKLNPEFVVRADPQLIMVVERRAENLRSRPGWQGLRALREDRICRFTAQEGDVLMRPGPRMAEAAQVMARCVNRFAPGGRP